MHHADLPMASFEMPRDGLAGHEPDVHAGPPPSPCPPLRGEGVAEEDMHEAPGSLAIPGKLPGGPLPVGRAAPVGVDRVGLDPDDPIGSAAHGDRALRVLAQGEARDTIAARQ